MRGQDVEVRRGRQGVFSFTTLFTDERRRSCDPHNDCGTLKHYWQRLISY